MIQKPKGTYDVLDTKGKTIIYIEKLIKYLENEGYVIDAKLVNERLRAINGEEIAWAVMDENLVN